MVLGRVVIGYKMMLYRINQLRSSLFKPLQARDDAVAVSSRLSTMMGKNMYLDQVSWEAIQFQNTETMVSTC